MTDRRFLQARMVAEFDRFLDANADCVIEDEKALFRAFLAGVYYGADEAQKIIKEEVSRGSVA